MNEIATPGGGAGADGASGGQPAGADSPEVGHRGGDGTSVCGDWTSRVPAGGYDDLIVSYLIVSYLILSYLILSYRMPLQVGMMTSSYLILSYRILSYLVLSYLIACPCRWV